MDLPDETLKQFVRHYLVCLQHATRLPVAGAVARAGAGPAMATASAPHLPGVGWLVGALACVVFALTALLLPDGPATPLAAACIATMATAWLTGALHERALARSIGAGQDARTLALLLLLATKLALLAVLATGSEAGVLATLFAAHVVSRLAPLALGHLLQAPGSTDRGGLAVAALWCAPPVVLMVVAGGVGFALLALAATVLASFALLRHLRGSAAPGDTGAAQQVAELAFYVGAAVGLGS
ncbi:MAG: adenosylcobinamide-GDP ribazoletransferase [Comamonadaceae bacterium]|nr:MAG: adenosylcobinamide-GDP ribazoletransferase [Comamonadaceae bacterium]